jgi:hypothetical protein
MAERFICFIISPAEGMLLLIAVEEIALPVLDKTW